MLPLRFPSIQLPRSLTSTSKGTQVASAQAVKAASISVPAGFRAFQVGQARVLNASPRQAQGNSADPMPGTPVNQVDRKRLGLAQVDLVVNGTFNIDNGPGTRREYPAGTIIRNGRVDAGGLPKTLGRGAMAVLQDGRVVVLRQGGSGKLEDIQKQVQARYGANARVRDFMGGGAMLVEGGNKVSNQDLRTRQQFDQGQGGINAQQMRRSDHTVVAQHKNGKTYVLVAANKTGKEIQDQLHAAGFVNVVKFDGSSGFIARTGSGPVDGRYQGTNVMGIAVDVVP
jgi:hypothetical protein